MVFPVTLSQPATSNVTVQYTVVGDTLPGYTATGGTKAGNGADFKLRSGTLTFKVGSKGTTPIAQNISVAVFGDTTTGEGNETFAVLLSNPSSGYALGKSVGTGTILNDDGIATGPTLGVGDTSIALQKSGTQSLKFEVTLSANAPSAFTVNYAITPGNATYSQKVTGGGDYGGKTSGTLSFTATTKMKTISIPIWADPNPDENETFTVTLSGLSITGVTLIGPTATGTIIG